MKFATLSAAVGAAMALAVAAPAAAETISVDFTTPDGGVTTGLYSGIVNVTVEGTGFSLGPNLNDAFYVYTPGTPYHDGSYYQLTFGTSPLVAYNPAQNAANFLVGALPAYNANHVYSFLLNTGAGVPVKLHFGVGDGIFGDNGGSFRVTVDGAVPEPASWALMIGGLGLVGASMRRRAAVRFA